MRAEYECAGCGTTFSGNHRVKGGEHYCTDCKPLVPGRGRTRDDYEPPTTVEEYEARKRTMIDVSALMEDGDQR